MNITGNTGVTAITLSSGRKRTVTFTGTPTITAGTSLKLINGVASLTVEAGAIAEFVADGSVVRMITYAAASQLAAQALLGIGAWQAYTPTVTSASGSFTTVSATGRYIQIGKLVFFKIAITVTANGSAATATTATLPVTAQNADFAFSGRENGVTGALLVAWTSSTTAVRIQKYDGTYIGGTGYILAVSGSYEAA